LNGEPVTILRTIEKQKRDEILRRIKVIEGATQRQIARVTGLNKIYTSDIFTEIFFRVTLSQNDYKG
jgi:hypothetical protein